MEPFRRSWTCTVAKTARFDLRLSKGQVLLPLSDGERCRLKIELPQR